MTYVTSYQRTVKPRRGPDAGKTVTRHYVYETKADTPMHKRLREAFKGETRTGDNIKVYACFVPGMPLDKPIVTGGTRI